ncbi:hypothetical protein JCM3770_000895 [Rhodotorula araucariae]
MHPLLAPISASQVAVSSRLAPSTWTRILPALPALWALLLLLLDLVQRLRRVLQPRRIRLEDDPGREPGQRPLFAVFVQEDDIISCCPPDHDDERRQDDPAAEGSGPAMPPPPLATTVVPVVEVVGWTAAFIVAAVQRTSATRILLSASHAVAWGYASTSQLCRRDPTAPLALLSLYVLLLLDTVFVLVQQARTLSTSPSPHLLPFLRRIPDLLLTSLLVTSILEMPLNAPVHPATKAGVRPRSPEDANSVLGAFTYSWMSGIMRVAKSRPLCPSDVWELSLNNRAEVLSRRFAALRSKTVTRKLLRASARDIGIDASLKLVASTCDYLRPFFVQKILENLTIAYTAPSPAAADAAWTPREKAYLFASLAFFAALVKTLAQQRHYHYARRIGMRLRSELTVALFEKALKRREAPAKETRDGEEHENSASVGKVISMISEDVNRVLRMGCDSHLLYGAPLELLLGLGFLYNLMGWSAFAGFSVMLLSVPLNYVLGKLAVRTVRRRQIAGDKRRTALQELIGDIRTVKLFGWSTAWIERVDEQRREELRWLAFDFASRYAYTTLWAVISVLVPLVSFWAYVTLQGEELTVAVAFTALSLFSLIRGPLNQIPGFGIRILQLNVSLARMSSFFAEPEVAPHAAPADRAGTSRLRLERATLRYAGADEGMTVLEEVSVEFPEGQLTVVSGPTGSGKSSLLLGLLGELEVVEGLVELPSHVSYAAQHPWLESLSIRDSILFGYPPDEARLRAVVRACALERDLEVLPDGMETFVGERGISLSGGQKARLALARAVYALTSHLLLDDIFSAIDAHTARHLLSQLFDSSLMRGRTCVLVTHHVELVRPIAAWEVVLEGGRVRRQGRVERVEAAAADAEEELERMEAAEGGGAVKTGGEADVSEPRTPAATEGWTSGAVKGEMYRSYFAASSYLLWSLALLVVLVRPILAFAEQFWLRSWGESAESGHPVDSAHYLAGYALIGGATAVTTLLVAVLVSLASLLASRALFHQLLVRVVAAPLRWFDLVPVGTIQNRFTNDVSIVDDGLADNLSSFASNIVAMVAALAVTSAVLPAALVSSIAFACIYASIFRSYLLVNRDVNRIAATTASPLFSSFGEALRGITTIRAFGKQKEYRARLCRIVDETLAFWYLGATLDIWLSIRTQFLSAFCLLATATFATYYRISPGLAGISITASQTVLLALDTLCSAYGRLVLSMNSLERIAEYLRVPQEPQGGVVPPASWPSAGGDGPLLEVKDLVMRYAPELPPVLHGVSFAVKAGERVGIVGRTGSGKSTLVTSLLRFSDPASGTIVVDGLDISKVSLEDLRRRITLVPQDAVLFEGVMRDNLDPFHEHSDASCFEALRRAHLLDPTQSSEGPVEADTLRAVTLYSQVSAGGTNWSAGQRQLIALARALLRNSRIVILDESSASLDHGLDAKLQQVIREEFRDAAVLTIAHRLRTVRDYDRVFVLDAGRIIEADTPEALLAMEGGVFRRMWEESGAGRDESAA